MNETSSTLARAPWSRSDRAPAHAAMGDPIGRLVATFEDAVLGRGGARRDVVARAWTIPAARDIRAESRRIAPILRDFVSFVPPPAPSRGALVEGLVPLAVRLGLVAKGAPSSSLPIEVLRFLGALADLLVTWEGDVRVIEPRFVLWGETPMDEVGRVRGHVVVLDPLGQAGEPGFGATLVWLAGLGVGRDPV